MLRIDAATIDAVRRTTNVAVYGAGNASHAQHYAATFASLRAAATRTDSSSWTARAGVGGGSGCIGVRVILADGTAGRRWPGLGYETALYVRMCRGAGVFLSIAGVDSCVAIGDGVRAYDLRKGAKGRLVAARMEPPHALSKALGRRAVARLGTNYGLPSTRVAIDESAARTSCT